MNIKIHEEHRNLQGFYPDPRVRHQVHYGYAHIFLPKYVHQNPTGFFGRFRDETPGGAQDPTKFIQSNWCMFEETAGLVKAEGDPFKEGMVFRRVTDLSMSVFEVGNRLVALVTMPPPERSPEAFFVAAVLETSEVAHSNARGGVRARVFTLEAVSSDKHPGEGVVCEWTDDGEHRNWGIGNRVDRDTFLGTVALLLKAPPSSAPGGFVPPGQGKAAGITLRLDDDAAPTPQTQGNPSKGERPWWKLW